MNREDTKRAIEVMTAFVEGRDVINSKGVLMHPNGICFPDWDWCIDGIDSYKIKPEPEVIYVNSADGDFYLHKTEAGAINATEGCEPLYKYIAKKFIEVVE